MGTHKGPTSLAYRSLSVYGTSFHLGYQTTFGNYPLKVVDAIARLIGQSRQSKVAILQSCDGLIRSGELVLVLGRPGSGCSTLLKTLAGRTDGVFLDDRSSFNYHGMFGIQILAFRDK